MLTCECCQKLRAAPELVETYVAYKTPFQMVERTGLACTFCRRGLMRDFWHGKGPGSCGTCFVDFDGRQDFANAGTPLVIWRSPFD